MKLEPIIPKVIWNPENWAETLTCQEQGLVTAQRAAKQTDKDRPIVFTDVQATCVALGFCITCHSHTCKEEVAMG